MNSQQLRELAPLLDHFHAYRQVLAAARDRSASCDCELSDDGRLSRFELGGQCAPPNTPADSCFTVVHLGIRAHLASIAMPVDHIGDVELDVAIDDKLHGLALRAPQLTAQQFVDQLQAALHADRVVVAAEQAAGGGDRTDG